jgi:starch synthase
MLRVLFVTSECAPWVKTGGLGDVSAALPLALRALGVDARVLLPAYPGLLDHVRSERRGTAIVPVGPWPASELREATLPSGVPALLIDCASLFMRPGGPYQDAQGNDYADNARRFGYFAHVAAMLCAPGSALPWRPDVLHCNDWQTALAPMFMRFAGARQAATVVTIHNLAFQGLFPGNLCAELGLPAEAYAIDGFEFYGQTSFLKAGIACADVVSTVSPTYAREIQRAPLGFGLEGLLGARADVLVGILNGIDTEVWNPAADAMITVRYDRDTLERKAHNKAALQRALGLDEAPDVPLFGMVSRLAWQKGSDLVAALISELVDAPAQFAIAGRGDRGDEAALEALGRRHRSRVAVAIRFDEALAHRIEAGADAFLMPSRFEPCGLNQMYSQRYGTPPIAHATGGLADSIVDVAPSTLAGGTGSGFLYTEPTMEALRAAALRMLEAYRAPSIWRAIQRAGMARDFGWRVSAQSYIDLYGRAMVRVPPTTR